MTVDDFGRAPLHYAALEDDAPQVEAVLARGGDPDIKDAEGFTPLHLAAQEGAVTAVRVLLDHGATVDIENAYGNTPLFVAVFNSRGRGDVIEMLRSRGADPHYRNRLGQTPVGLARLIDNFDVARFFADLPVEAT